MLRSFPLLAALALLAPAGCSREEQPPGPAAAAAAPAALAPVDPRTFSVTGTVVELLPAESQVRIAHEEIPSYMKSMTMRFNVRDSRETAGLGAGDRVTFRLLVTTNESWIDQVARVGATEALTGSPAAEPPLDPSSGAVRIVREVEPLEVGDVMTDYTFTNQLGAPVRLSDLRGQAVGITFIFTRCPLPDFCPRMVNNFAAAATRLRETPDAPSNWRLLSLTIDPDYDTPAVLAAYAQRHHADPGRWSFLTGAMIDIDAISEQFGVVFRRRTPGALPDHNLRTVVIDATGRVQRILVGNTWRADEFVAEMIKAAQATAGP